MNTQQVANAQTTGYVVLPGIYVDGPADRFVEIMEDAEGFDLVVLASRAIRHDPGCIEARLVLAEAFRDYPTRLRHLRAAVASGDYLGTPIAENEGDDMTWWGFSASRPYMRAIHDLGQTLLELGDATEAREYFDRLLAMNPHDNRGIRYIVAEMDAQSPTMRMP